MFAAEIVGCEDQDSKPRSLFPVAQRRNHDSVTMELDTDMVALLSSAVRELQGGSESERSPVFMS